MLARIVETKRAEVEALRARATGLAQAAEQAPAPKDFERALRSGDGVAVIAEVKRRSPGAGEIRPDLDPGALARGYARAGASAVSVLTDRDYFGGSLADLTAVRDAVPVPVLRKDFVIDRLQVTEARAAGADAVLLIARILDDAQLGELFASVTDLGMSALVEIHDAEELERAAAAGARVIGINNRDLGTFTTDLSVTLGLLGRVPAEAVIVSESGIRTRADVERLGDEGVDAVLVGESLLRAEDPRRALRSLAGCQRRERARA
jgi:indole-3-glycerol phosphate synthase